MKSKNHHLPTPVSNGNTSEGSSPSPPPSPRRQSAAAPAPHCRRLLRSKTFSQSRRESSVAGIIIRRGLRYFLLLPLFYISGLLMCVGPFSGLVWQSPLPGSVYRSHEIFEKLWHEIESDNFSAIELSSVWRYSRRLKDQKPCPNTSSRHHFAPKHVSPDPSGYLIVEANGGLNQQRSSICNAVAVAGLLNAILVIPHLDFHSVWMDPSEFGDIFDEDHFIRTLKGFVEVVQELPEVVMERFDYNMSNIPNIRIEAWAPVSYYLEEVYPVLRKQGVIRIAPFANRLAMNVPPHVQFLRCFANNVALRFSFPVSTLAKKLVTRMIEKSSRTGGKYVSVHLRFEEDMLAFSCCLYDGGKAERIEMDLVREKGWRGKFSRKGRLIQPGLNRVNGKCPLTPLEVGMMLRGMGFDNGTSIYLASGKIYQAERHLDPLRKMFPLLYTKGSLATSEELAPFKGYSSRLAALDYTVCLYSEVFVTTQGGNFPHFLMGHRRYLFGGHAKTIQPDKRKLVILLQNIDMSWKAFKNQMESMLIHSDRKGTDVLGPKKSRRKSSIYAYPWPECRCLLESQNSTIKLSPTPFMLDDEAESII